MDYKVGQRVQLSEDADMSDAVKVLHGDDQATVLRRTDRNGSTRYLRRFDRSDAVYGMYWVSGGQLAALEAAHPA